MIPGMIPGRWSIYIYDWDTHERIAPLVRAADSLGSLLVPELERAHAFLLGAPDDSSPQLLAVGCLVALCGVGEPARLGPDVPGVLRRLRRSPGGDDLAEHLGELLYGAPNVEEWFETAEAPMGLLTVDQTMTLGRAADRYRRGLSDNPPVQRGFRSLARFLTANEPETGGLDDLLVLLDDAVHFGHGLAAVGEDA